MTYSPRVLLIYMAAWTCATCLVASARSSTAEECAGAATSALVVNVKDKGAKGDGRANDTAAIQAAIDGVAGTGGTVLVPNGTYLVDAVNQRLQLKSDMTLMLSDGATLKAIPNNSKRRLSDLG